MLYVLFTADFSTFEETTIAVFADDTAILPEGDIRAETNKKLHCAVDHIHGWTCKLNERNFVRVTFAKCKIDSCHCVVFNGKLILQNNSAKYVYLHLDFTLTWEDAY